MGEPFARIVPAELSIQADPVTSIRKFSGSFPLCVHPWAQQLELITRQEPSLARRIIFNNESVTSATEVAFSEPNPQCYSHECMSGLVLDGKKVRDEILEELRPRVENLRLNFRAPALAVGLGGDDPASQIYVRGKIKASQELGIRSVEIKAPGDISTDALLDLLGPLSQDDSVDGILVQMPLPPQIDSRRVATTVISPDRDVDGFGAASLGAL